MENMSTPQSSPLPHYTLPRHWQTIPILESNDPLVALEEYSPDVLCDPQYNKMGIPNALDRCYARKSVALRLQRVTKALESYGLALVVWDSWRPVSVQQAIFDSFRKELECQNPELSAEELNRMTETYVAMPSVNPERPSPHLTGGAIDVTLARYSGKRLDMGTGFDDFSERAATHYFEHIEGQSSLTKSDRNVQKNRRLLFYFMANAGFTNYFEEWWHFDYGNQFWAATNSEPFAHYGPIIDIP